MPNKTHSISIRLFLVAQLIGLTILIPISIYYQRRSRETELLRAADIGDYTTVERLLRLGTNPNICSNEGFSPLALARFHSPERQDHPRLYSLTGHMIDQQRTVHLLEQHMAAKGCAKDGALELMSKH